MRTTYQDAERIRETYAPRGLGARPDAGVGTVSALAVDYLDAVSRLDELERFVATTVLSHAQGIALSTEVPPGIRAGAQRVAREAAGLLR